MRFLPEDSRVELPIVTQAVGTDNKLITRIQVQWGTWEPRSRARDLAPGSLYAAQHPHEEIVQLHSLVEAKADVLTFETFLDRATLPKTGESYVYGVWWIPDATALVETPLRWRKQLVHEHDHCLLCWKSLEGSEAYGAENQNDDLICNSCYVKFIEHGPPWARRP